MPNLEKDDEVIKECLLEAPSNVDEPHDDFENFDSWDYDFFDDLEDGDDDFFDDFFEEPDDKDNDEASDDFFDPLS